MTYSLVFELAGLPEAYNKLMRMHWAARLKHNNGWTRSISLITTGKRPSSPLSKAQIKLTRFSAVRPDDDNLRGSFKCIVDALTTLGIIEDDRFEVIGSPVVLWEKVKPGKGMIRVEVKG